MSTTTMFEDQTVELLPARTTMKRWGGGGGKAHGGGGNKVIKIIQVNIAINSPGAVQTNSVGG
jgi:hypothetical protein